jgi:hypothetical protein
MIERALLSIVPSDYGALQRKDMGRWGQRRALRRHSPAAHRARLADVYDELGVGDL